jgi:hypothetical protein
VNHIVMYEIQSEKMFGDVQLGNTARYLFDPPVDVESDAFDALAGSAEYYVSMQMMNEHYRKMMDMGLLSEEAYRDRWAKVVPEL